MNRGLLAGAVLVLCGVAWASVARGPWAELAGNLRWQAALACAAGAIVAWARRRWASGVLALCAASAAAWPWVRLWMPIAGERDARPGGVEWTLATVNANYETRDFRALGAWVAATRADVVVLTEVTRAGRAALEECAQAFPHRLYAPFPDGPVEVYTQALLSRLPVLEHDFGAPRPAVPGASPPIVGPRYRALLDVGGRPLLLVATHAPRPFGGGRHAFRVGHFHALAELEWRAHAVLVGDLNATAGSPLFGELVERSGLRDARRGYGRQPTWVPARALSRWPCWLTAPVALDLDHVLIGTALEVLEHRVGPPIGSDHRPVLVRLRVRP